MLERFFRLGEHRTTPSIEIMAGVTTFLTSAYILVVNPMVQSSAGMPRPALFTATCIAIIAGTLLMGLMANMPFILAPGMGINMYFAYAIVQGKGYSWQEALTAVLLAGILFVLSGVLGLRQLLLRSFPEPMKHMITVSLGLMIAVIGMKSAGIIVIKEGFVALGNIRSGGPALALIGILATGLLLAAKMRAAVLLGIILTTVLGIFTGVTDYNSLKEGFVSLPPSISPIAMAFSFDTARILTLDFLIVIFTLFIIDMFDSLGTFVGVLNRFEGGDLKRYENDIPKALMADAIATVVGSCVGTSTVTTYVESSTGIAAGGRTGLTSMTIIGLVIIALFASPMFLMIPAAATAPALIVVGMYMMAQAAKIDFYDAGEGIPAVIGILVTALTSSISDGLMLCWVGYVAIKVLRGKRADMNAPTIVVGVFFLLRLLFL